MTKVGIIGGSGLDEPGILQDAHEIEVETKYGKPASPLMTGKISGIDVVILARHGRKHQYSPTQVPNLANIWALKEQGCTHILATSACGSLKEEIGRGHFVILDQFIDFTKHRENSFHYDFSEGMKHTSMACPFDENLRNILFDSAVELGLYVHKKGCVVTIEGPRFSSRAESNMFRAWGADIVNMSTAPEAALANEAGIPYAVVAMSTDYDCWKKDEEPVTWDEILKVFNKNAENVKRLLVRAVQKIGELDKDEIKSKIRTVPHFPKHGIMFRDITTLLQDSKGLKKVIEEFVIRYKDKKLDKVVAIESRGFILGGALAHELGAGFVPLRKPGKLPYIKESEEYELEYGTDKLEIHVDAIKQGDNVLIIDDLLATSGTCLAACNLVRRLGGKIVECAFIIELEDLGGRDKLKNQGCSVFSIVKFKESE